MVEFVDDDEIIVILVRDMFREIFGLETLDGNEELVDSFRMILTSDEKAAEGRISHDAAEGRKALLQQIESLGTDRVRLEFRMPSRGLFGYRNQFLTDTHGEGIINQIFDGYDVWAGMIANRSTGSLVSFETGEAVTYGLFNAQQRGTLLVGAGEKVYEGMVIGYTASGEDVDVNVCKTKHLTNTRASGSDDALRLIPISKLSLEGCLEFLAQDELLEVTPENLRIRKQILNHEQRMKAKSKMK